MKKNFYIAFIILLVGLILTSGIFIYRNLKEERKQDDIIDKISIIAEQTENIANEEIKDDINFEGLYEINPDIIGWIRIEGTNIDYPIMQTKDRPNYYFRKNFYKEYSFLGTPYLAEQCDLNSSDNLIIYGHNIRKQKMFGELENYKNEEYYKQHKIITLYTQEGKTEYEIISVLKTKAHSDFEYYKYYNLQDESKFNTFINQCNELAFYNTEKTAEYGDKLLTLSTCEYSQENGRLIVIAKMI